MPKSSTRRSGATSANSTSATPLSSPAPRLDMVPRLLLDRTRDSRRDRVEQRAQIRTDELQAYETEERHQRQDQRVLDERLARLGIVFGLSLSFSRNCHEVPRNPPGAAFRMKSGSAGLNRSGG